MLQQTGNGPVGTGPLELTTAQALFPLRRERLAKVDRGSDRASRGFSLGGDEDFSRRGYYQCVFFVDCSLMLLS